MKRLLGVVTTCALILLSLSSNAALLSRLSGQAVYDTDLNITWLADFNLAQTNGFDADGRLSWNDAQNWINHLNTNNHLGFNDWRLPASIFPDAGCSIDGSGNSASAGTGCTESEMGHLFYDELGGTAGSSILDSGDSDLLLFTNIQADRYWSGTDLVTDTTRAWRFNFNTGDLFANLKSGDLFVSAVVRSGDVVVPVPAAVWLFGSGLLGLLGLARRQRVLS